MLAAVPDYPRPLELVRLVLSMIAQNGQNIPPELKSFLVEVIHEAQSLAENPANASTIRHPEAIQLALEMKLENALADSLSHITTFESIRPEVANRMLLKMECHPA